MVVRESLFSTKPVSNQCRSSTVCSGILLACLLIYGCNSSSGPRSASYSSSSKTITPMDNQNITLKNGETKLVSFPSLATSGYIWDFEVADQNIAEVKREEPAEDTRKPTSDHPMPIGTSPDERF